MRHPTPRTLLCSALAISISIGSVASCGSPGGDGGRTAIAADPATGGPPFSPEDALRTLQLEDGFRVELFAGEPLVADPVAMEIDEYGRVYVVQMHGYPLDVEGSGRVVLLTDTNGDGLPDSSSVFADGLRLPTGIMRWKGGVIVTDAPDVLYLEDSTGDGRADVRDVLMTGFALSNPQHNTNTPVYGLDNWIYLAHEGVTQTLQFGDLFGDEGEPVRFASAPGSPELPVNAGGRNVRFRPGTRELEMLSSSGQFGHTFDAWGRHFHNTNNRHVYHEVVAARYLARNPDLVVPSVVQHLPDYGLPAEVFPITDDPDIQMLTDVGIMTSAAGLTYYLGDLFPEAYRDVVFVGESAHNLVHAARVRPDGVSFRASRLDEGREFLASTDSWFRPVNFYVGPDGALYVIDYYRAIIEHPEWLDDHTTATADLYAGRDRGRIFRVVPEGAPPPDWLGRLRLGDAADEELVRTLEHPNLWWRRHAQRLLVDRGSQEAVPPLERLAAESSSAVARVHALWTLQGLGRLRPAVIEQAMGDEVAGVRENAIQLAELHLPRTPALADRLTRMGADPDPRVRFQLLLTLGDVDTAEAATLRRGLLLEHLEDEWMQVAGLSARAEDVLALHSAAVAELTGSETPGRRTFFERLGTTVGARGRSEEVRRVLRTAADHPGAEAAWWRTASLDGLATGLRRSAGLASLADADRVVVLGLADASEQASVRRSALRLLETIGLPDGAPGARARAEASRLFQDRDADPELRADAVRLLALDDASRNQVLFRRAIEPGERAAVQVAGIRALAQFGGAELPSLLLDRWRGWTPSVRDEAVRALLREQAGVAALIAAVEQGTVNAAEIERHTRIRLMMNEDDALRARARALFDTLAGEATEAVERYRSALALRGDAEAGRRVFARACSICHQYGGTDGLAFGPDLAEVRNRPPALLLDDILNPNRSIADGFELWIVELADGSSEGGILAGETPTTIRLRRMGGSEVALPRSEIRSMVVADVSGMPEGLEHQIDHQEMADLITFIRSGGR